MPLVPAHKSVWAVNLSVEADADADADADDRGSCAADQWNVSVRESGVLIGNVGGNTGVSITI